MSKRGGNLPHLPRDWRETTDTPGAPVVQDAASAWCERRTTPNALPRRIIECRDSSRQHQHNNRCQQQQDGTHTPLCNSLVDNDLVLPEDDTRMTTADYDASSGNSVSAHLKRPSGRDYRPSHLQIANLVCKCLPRHMTKPFMDDFKTQLTAIDTTHPCGGRPGNSTTSEEYFALIGKTPMAAVINSLVEVFGEDRISVRSPQSAEELRGACTLHQTACSCDVVHVDAMDFYLMEVVLSREVQKLATQPASTTLKKKTNNKKSLKQPTADPDAPVKIAAYSSEELQDSPENDNIFRSVIAYIPDAGIFYCVRQKRTKSEGVEGTLIPLDSSWLRFRRHGPRWFAKGSYVRRLFLGDHASMDDSVKDKTSTADCPRSIFRVRIDGQCTASGTHTRVRVLQMLQCPDFLGPRLPPDFMADGTNPGNSLNRRAEERSKYRGKLRSSASMKKGCRQYVLGALHKTIPEDCLVIEATSSMAYDLQIGIQVHAVEKVSTHTKRRAIGILRQSVVKVRFPLATAETLSSLDCLVSNGMALLARSTSRGTVRSGKGDLGNMFALGSHADQRCTSMIPYSGNVVSGEDTIQRAVMSMSRLGSTCFPMALRVIQDLERDSGLTSLPYMIKNVHRRKPYNGPPMAHMVGMSMDVSDNLSNSSHYDIHDASVGFAVWTEKHAGTSKNWYFVLPNVYGRCEQIRGGHFNGVAIRLRHGMAISWDGRVIRHCTSVMDLDCVANQHVFGTFCAAKSKNISCALNMLHDTASSSSQSLRAGCYPAPDNVVFADPEEASELVYESDDSYESGDVCVSPAHVLGSDKTHSTNHVLLQHNTGDMRYSSNNKKKAEHWWGVNSVGGSGYACRNPEFSVCKKKARSTYEESKKAGCASSTNPDFPVAVCEENHKNGSSYNKPSENIGLLSLPIARKRRDFVNRHYKDASEGEKQPASSCTFAIRNSHNANQQPPNYKPLQVVRSTTRIELSDGTVYEVDNNHKYKEQYEMKNNHPRYEMTQEINGTRSQQDNNHYVVRDVFKSPTSLSSSSNSQRQYPRRPPNACDVVRRVPNNYQKSKRHQNHVDLSFYGPASHLPQDNRHYVQSDVSTPPSSVTISERYDSREPSIATSDVDTWDLHNNRSTKQRRRGSIASLDNR